ncbi:MAG: S8 family serine peptidase [Candidatus Thorarchaeota archaeon]|nr:MAG: S8 family serine peptidase [Candidatus Thorarchaeota archaeon]
MSETFFPFPRRLLVIAVLTLLIAPSPVLLATSISSGSSVGRPIIGPTLAAEIQKSSADSVIPIVLHFPEGFTSEEMEAELERESLPGLSIRHIFHIMPKVSAVATAGAIEEALKISSLVGISLDQKVRALSTDTVLSSQQVPGALGYTHPDVLLDADDFRDQGYDGSGVTVAIIDSGADGDHPDLDGRIIGFRDMIGNQDDLDPSDGIAAYDDNGHGTAVAWLVAGTGAASSGVYTGMAPGADLLIIKSLDAAGEAANTLLAEAIEYARDSGVDIISLSVGGDWIQIPLLSDPTIAACESAVAEGITVVIAAGNDGPAALTLNSPGVTEEAITIASTSGASGVIGFSSRGPVQRLITPPLGMFAKPDVSAPGYKVMSARAVGILAEEFPIYNSSQFGTSYTIWSGTSASTPQIAGLVALLMDKHPGLSPLEIKTALMAGATDLGDDPMAQGWGLANVTRSSELLESSSGVFTLLAPMRFPALPGSPLAFVAGDERDPQNVTVLSTVNRGTLAIEMSGNASQFITTDAGSVRVNVGYSYFGITLDIPDLLPLTAAGEYTGRLALMDGTTEITGMDLSFEITFFGGSVLVDMSHHSADDPDDPTFYKFLREYLRDQRMVIDELGSPDRPIPASYASLSSSDAFMVMDTEEAYSVDEIEAIHDYVEDGGVLLILSEFYDTSTDVASFGFESYNQILEPYGIQCERRGIGGLPTDLTGDIYGADYGGAVEDHPLVEGVRNLFIIAGSTLSVDPNVAGAQGLLWTDSAKTHAIVATVDFGEGKVIAISDGSALYDSTTYDAIRYGADNLALLRNVAAALIPERPSVLAVDFNTGKIGDIANVTAYVFDDTLESVGIEISLPNGTNISPPAVESLGYMFVSEFTLVSGGFYDVVLTARDTSGNTKILSRTFLVPVNLADDTFIITVVVSLVAVVAVGLGFVAIKRLGIGRRPQREWEPRWEDTSGAPPAIE